MGDVPTDPSQAQARQQLIDWAHAQGLWVREIVRQVLASRQELAAAAFDAVYTGLLAEKELSAETPPADFTLALGAGAIDGVEPLRLERLGDVEHDVEWIRAYASHSWLAGTRTITDNERSRR